MNVPSQLQNSTAALRRVIGPQSLCSTRSRSRQPRPRRSHITERSFLTDRSTGGHDTYAEHVRSQNGTTSIQFVSWKPKENIQRAARPDEACTGFSERALGLGWPSLHQWTAGFDESRKRRPERLGFSVSHARNTIAADDAHHSGRCLDEATLESAVDTAIHEKDPYKLLSAMLDASRSAFLVNMSPEKFRSTLRLLGPKHFINPYQQAIATKNKEFTPTRPFPYVTIMFRRYVESLLKLVSCRRASGCEVGLEEYKVLLMAAASARRQDVASHVWIAMLEDNIEPDLATYNCLFESLCYASTH
ncbi:MAG: hypothetical protein Q9164_007657, partial [Protoblastenia rupestris]